MMIYQLDILSFVKESPSCPILDKFTLPVSKSLADVLPRLSSLEIFGS